MQHEGQLNGMAGAHAGDLGGVGEQILVDGVVLGLVLAHEVGANPEADLVGVLQIALGGVFSGVSLLPKLLVALGVQLAVKVENGLVVPEVGHFVGEVLEVELPVSELVGVAAQHDLHVLCGTVLECLERLGRKVVAVGGGSEDQRDLMDMLGEEISGELHHDVADGQGRQFLGSLAAHHFHEFLGIGSRGFRGVVELDGAGFANGPLEESLGGWCDGQQHGGTRTAGFAKEGDPVRISAEGSDVLLDPLQGSHLVHEP